MDSRKLAGCYPVFSGVWAFPPNYCPLGNAAVSYPGNTFGGSSTIQSAITNAGLAGAVVIPPNYVGTDRFTNPHSISITNPRPAHLSVRGEARSLKEFGLKCDGNTDDTDNFQAVLTASNALIGPNDTVLIPEGECRITHPLIVTVTGSWLPSILGSSGAESAILADYGSWIGTDYAALEYVTTGPVSSRPQNFLFGGFAITAENVTTQATIAFSSHTNATGAGMQTIAYAPLVGADVSNLFLAGFGVGVDLQEMWQSHIHNIFVFNTNQILHVHGEVVNVFVDSTFYSTPLLSSATGILLESKTYGSTSVGPEGIQITNNLVYGAQTAIDIESGYWIRVVGNLFDGCTGDCIRVNAPQHMDLQQNFVFTSGANAIHLLPLTSAQGELGQWTGNFLTGSGATAGQAGLFIEGGGKVNHWGLRFDQNSVNQFQDPVKIASSPFSSSFRDNFFANDGVPSIKITGKATRDVFVDGNSSNTTGVVVTNSSSAAGYILGINCDVSQTCSAADFPGGVTVGNKNICLSDGTNCPPPFSNITGSVKLSPGRLSAGSCVTGTASITGATVGHLVNWGIHGAIPSGPSAAYSAIFASVTSKNTVTVEFCSSSSSFDYGTLQLDLSTF